jgi:hypothetical protein
VPWTSRCPTPTSRGCVSANRAVLIKKTRTAFPARKTERINLRFPRPDVSVAVDPNNLVTDNQGNYIVSTEGNTQDPENNGNLDGISVTP